MESRPASMITPDTIYQIWGVRQEHFETQEVIMSKNAGTECRKRWNSSFWYNSRETLWYTLDPHTMADSLQQEWRTISKHQQLMTRNTKLLRKQETQKQSLAGEHVTAVVSAQTLSHRIYNKLDLGNGHCLFSNPPSKPGQDPGSPHFFCESIIKQLLILETSYKRRPHLKTGKMSNLPIRSNITETKSRHVTSC